MESNKKFHIGELIEPFDERNGVGSSLFYGININKDFMPTVANTEGLDKSKYKVVRNGQFVYSGMQTGRDKCIRIGMYRGDHPIIVSPAYTTFRIVRTDIVLPLYFFMIFQSKEMDRLGWFCSDGSIRSNLDWDRFCDFEITLPRIPMQEKYVAIYSALVENQKAYENGLDDLKLTCDAYVENLRRIIPCEKIGPYIKPINEKNSNHLITLEQGININKEFISPQRSNSDLSSRVVVRNGQIAYCTQLNNENVAIALRDGDDCVVSPVYSVIDVKDKTRLLPKYLLLWLMRPEWGRFVYWSSTGSAYEFLQYENVCDTKIPIPDIKTQQYIVAIYNAYKMRREINEKLKAQIKDICPILIRGSLENGG